ncbi:symplekin, partial [Phenoliferia sp. Uapishka_3]
ATLWAHVISLKTSSLRLFRSTSLGPRLSSLKVLQRIIQSQTRGPADPRLQRTAEPNLLQVPPHHPFLRPQVLEDEANSLVEECITLLFTSEVGEVVGGLATVLVGLVKARAGFTQLVVTALTNWSPNALEGKGRSSAVVRSTEKAVRSALLHLMKTAPSATFEPYIQPTNSFLSLQQTRMEEAQTLAKSLASKKRQAMTDSITDSVKRRKIEEPSSSSSSSFTPIIVDMKTAKAFREIADSCGTPRAMKEFDAKSVELEVVVEIVIMSLQDQGERALEARIEDARRAIEVESNPIPVPSSRTSTPLQQQTQTSASLNNYKNDSPAPPFIKPEEGRPIDPLKIDLGPEADDEVLQMAPPIAEVDEAADESDSENASALTTLAPTFDSQTTSLLSSSSSTLSQSAKSFMIESAVRRICSAGMEGAAPAVWVPLVSRLITRGLGEGGGEGDGEEGVREKLRAVMFEFVVGDIGARLDFARLWLNEEWYVEGNKGVEEIAEGRPYDRWLRRLLEHILQHSSNKDKAFTQFIVDLPTIPNEEISRFGAMCTNPEQVQLGFAALRDLTVMRPPVRQAALDVLLSLTTHPDKLTRNAAINTVKRWVPDVSSLSTKVLSFSISILSRLENAPPPPPPAKPELAPDDMAESDDEEEEEKPVVRLDALVKDGVVVEGLPPAENEGNVVQHVELFFALSVKYPDLLDQRFQTLAQESIQTLVTPLIKNLGVTSPKLLQLIEECPPGSESLVLRVLTILADKSRLPKPVVTAVRNLAKKREGLSPRFLIIIVGECDKSEMFEYIPRIVTVLNNTPEEKLQVRSAFLSVLAPASLSFAATANAVRQRHELLTPVELMVLLHTSEKEMGLKQTIEAIGICFTMPDAFRAEILAAFMTQVIDEPVIPVLFLRTVIQAVTTYKTLVPFVSTTLLSRLIQKKVWTTAPLWAGFIRCAVATQPHSFGALLLLPKEQLLDVVTKQPLLKEPLREYALKKAGNTNRMAAALEVLGPAEGEPTESDILMAESGDVAARRTRSATARENKLPPTRARSSPEKPRVRRVILPPGCALVVLPEPYQVHRMGCILEFFETDMAGRSREVEGALSWSLADGETKVNSKPNLSTGDPSPPPPTLSWISNLDDELPEDEFEAESSAQANENFDLPPQPDVTCERSVVATSQPSMFLLANSPDDAPLPTPGSSLDSSRIPERFSHPFDPYCDSSKSTESGVAVTQTVSAFEARIDSKSALKDRGHRENMRERRNTHDNPSDSSIADVARLPTPSIADTRHRSEAESTFLPRKRPSISIVIPSYPFLPARPLAPSSRRRSDLQPSKRVRLDEALKDFKTMRVAFPATSDLLFSGIGFLLTKVHCASTDSSGAKNFDVDATSKLICELGGTILHLSDLIDIEASNEEGDLELSLKVEELAERGVSKIMLLADGPTGTLKFLSALALGVPCLSWKFVEASKKLGSIPNVDSFRLSSGFSHKLGAFVSGSHTSAQRDAYGDVVKLQSAYKAGTGFLADLRFYFITTKHKRGKR